jgi:hypothetical protein
MVDSTKAQIIQLYGAIIVSVLIVLGFVLGLYEAYAHSDQHNVDMLGNLINNAVMIVVGYWLGSSISSQKKDALLLNATPAIDDGKIPPPPKAV